MENGFEWGCQCIEGLCYETWQRILYIQESRRKGNLENIKKERHEAVFLEKVMRK